MAGLPSAAFDGIQSCPAADRKFISGFILASATNQFMEKDHDNQSRWIELDKRMVIQELLAESDKETRVYVVTIDTPPEYAWIHDRWPRLVRLPDQ